MEGPSSFLDAPDPQPSGQLIMTEGVSNVILGLVPWLRTGAPLLLVGPEGCGKATLLQHCLDQLAVRHPPTQPCTSILSCCLLIEHAHFATAMLRLATWIPSICMGNFSRGKVLGNDDDKPFGLPHLSHATCEHVLSP